VDLVCIAEKSDPPVCKIVDYGKMRYEQERKKKDQKKKAKTNEIKEVKMSYKIGEGDYQVRRRAATKFIKNGNRVKLAIQRGRRVASFFSSFSPRDASSPAGSAAASSSSIAQGRAHRDTRERPIAPRAPTGVIDERPRTPLSMCLDGVRRTDEGLWARRRSMRVVVWRSRASIGPRRRCNHRRTRRHKVRMGKQIWVAKKPKTLFINSNDS